AIPKVMLVIAWENFSGGHEGQSPKLSDTSGPSGRGRVRIPTIPHACVPPPDVWARAVTAKVFIGGKLISVVQIWLPQIVLNEVCIATIGMSTSFRAERP